MEQKGLKILTHASTWFAPILVPLIVYFISSNRETKNLALQAVLFHFVIGFLIGLSFVFSWLLIGLPFLVLFGLVALIAPLLGIFRAIKEESFRYPIVGRWIN